jgi:hypothetical protein
MNTTHGYSAASPLRQDLSRILPAVQQVLHEHDVFVVMTSRSLRVLNPWAILANAVSLRRAA